MSANQKLKERSILSRAFESVDQVPINIFAEMVGVNVQTIEKWYPKAIEFTDSNRKMIRKSKI